MKFLKLKKIFAICIVVLLSTSMVIGCAKTEEITENDVAIVNGARISLDDFNNNLALVVIDYEKEFGENVLEKDDGTGKTLLESVKEQILDKLVMDEILLQEAAKNEITASDEKIEEAFTAFSEFKENDEQFKKSLDEHGVSDEFIKKQIEQDYIMEQYMMFFIEKATVTEEEARKFYDDNPEYFNTEEVKASHILINDEELANEIRARIEKGEDFKELAMQYSEDPGSKELGGDLGFFGRGRMIPEFEEAAFALEIGEVSEPISSMFGYHIILLEDRIAEIVEFDEVKESILAHLKRLSFQSHTEELKINAEITLNESI
ncbi:peptidylprolyl isomerase [bacterium AH-315-E09]|nr:peptidylprolyl isomerase [Alkaliphilus transvaalensis]MBN4074469.1 peptidylprolyl isomerase [bacterium AH-315-E09]